MAGKTAALSGLRPEVAFAPHRFQANLQGTQAEMSGAAGCLALFQAAATAVIRVTSGWDVMAYDEVTLVTRTNLVFLPISLNE